MEIRVELEDVSTVKKKLKVEVPAGVALKEFNQIAAEYKKHARLPGFRPGKAPVELVKRHYRKDIRSDLLQKLIPDSYDQAVKEKAVHPIGEPSLEQLTFEEGEALVYEANFEVQPKIDLPEYRGLEVRLESRPLTDEDVEEELRKLQEAHSRLVAVEGRAAREGDYVAIDLSGEYLDAEDEGLEPFHEENVVVKVGEEHTHQSFTEALTGSRVGEQKEFEVEYAEDYPEKKLAGRRLRFAARVNEVKERELPELSDEFARDLAAYQSLAELREDIRTRLREQRESTRESDLGNRILEKLIEGSSFEVPDLLVEERIDGMIRELAYNMASKGLDPSKADVDWMRVRADFRGDAGKQVRANMLLGEIGQQEKIEVAEEEVEGEIRRAADSMKQPVEKVRQYFQKHNRMEGMRRQLVRSRVLKILVESAKVTER